MTSNVINEKDPKEILAEMRSKEKQAKEENEKRQAVQAAQELEQMAKQEKEGIIADAIGKLFYLSFDGFRGNVPAFNFPLVENGQILVAYKLLPEETEIGSKLWVMLLGKSEEYVKDYNLVGIPSPIKKEYIEQWNNMMAAWKKGEAITATIVDTGHFVKIKYPGHCGYDFLRKEIILDIGCEVQASCIYPTEYIKGQKIGDTLMVHIENICSVRSNLPGNHSSFRSLQAARGRSGRGNLPGNHSCKDLIFGVSIKSPNFEQLKKEYEKLKEERIKKIIQEKQKDTFILDTNIIMDFPELFTYFLELKKQIVVAYNVVEELDGLKDSDDKDRASKARRGLHAINDNIGSIKLETPSSDLLPKGLGKKNDNDIISVALKYKNNASNALLVTNDIGVTVKSKALEINVWNCVEDMV